MIQIPLRYKCFEYGRFLLGNLARHFGPSFMFLTLLWSNTSLVTNGQIISSGSSQLDLPLANSGRILATYPVLPFVPIHAHHHSHPIKAARRQLAKLGSKLSNIGKKNHPKWTQVSQFLSQPVQFPIQQQAPAFVLSSPLLPAGSIAQPNIGANRDQVVNALIQSVSVIKTKLDEIINLLKVLEVGGNSASLVPQHQAPGIRHLPNNQQVVQSSTQPYLVTDASTPTILTPTISMPRHQASRMAPMFEQPAVGQQFAPVSQSVLDALSRANYLLRSRQMKPSMKPQPITNLNDAINQPLPEENRLAISRRVEKTPERPQYYTPILEQLATPEISPPLPTQSIQVDPKIPLVASSQLDNEVMSNQIHESSKETPIPIITAPTLDAFVSNSIPAGLIEAAKDSVTTLSNVNAPAGHVQQVPSVAYQPLKLDGGEMHSLPNPKSDSLQAATITTPSSESHSLNSVPSSNNLEPPDQSIPLPQASIVTDASIQTSISPIAKTLVREREESSLKQPSALTINPTSIITPTSSQPPEVSVIPVKSDIPAGSTYDFKDPLIPIDSGQQLDKQSLEQELIDSEEWPGMGHQFEDEVYTKAGSMDKNSRRTRAKARLAKAAITSARKLKHVASMALSEMEKKSTHIHDGVEKIKYHTAPLIEKSKEAAHLAAENHGESRRAKKQRRRTRAKHLVQPVKLDRAVPDMLGSYPIIPEISRDTR